MDTVDRNLWIFYGLGLVSIMLLLGATMLWWQTRAWQRGPLRWSSPIDRPVVAGLHSAGSAKRPWWFAPSERIEAWLRPWPGMARYERLLRQTGWPYLRKISARRLRLTPGHTCRGGLFAGKFSR